MSVVWRAIFIIQTLFLLWVQESADAFVIGSPRRSFGSTTLQFAPSDSFLASITEHDPIRLFSYSSSSLLLAVDYVELSKNVGLTLLGVFAFFVGLTYVTVNVLIPQASRQVEQEIKALDPALWDEYLLKLKPGETMDQRPDLIQELGNKVLELQEKQFQLLNRNQSSDMSSTDNQVSEASKEPRSVLDVEILSKNPWEDE